MADRSLRGMRLGSQSLQSEEGVEFASRRKSIYRTETGVTFDVMFSSDAEVPEVWSSPKTGQEGRLVADDGTLVKYEVVETKAPRTHWDMLLERRSRAELEELLQERLGFLRARRGQDAKTGRKSA
jgi:RNA polymerase-binding protein